MRLNTIKTPYAFGRSCANVLGDTALRQTSQIRKTRISVIARNVTESALAFEELGKTFSSYCNPANWLPFVRGTRSAVFFQNERPEWGLSDVMGKIATILAARFVSIWC